MITPASLVAARAFCELVLGSALFLSCALQTHFRRQTPLLSKHAANWAQKLAQKLALDQALVQALVQAPVQAQAQVPLTQAREVAVNRKLTSRRPSDQAVREPQALLEQLAQWDRSRAKLRDLSQFV